MTSFSARFGYTDQEIRSLALYPDELRARARITAVSGRFPPFARQRQNGTERKHAAHCGTLLSQRRTHNGPMGDGNLHTGPTPSDRSAR